MIYSSPKTLSLFRSTALKSFNEDDEITVGIFQKGSRVQGKSDSMQNLSKSASPRNSKHFSFLMSPKRGSKKRIADDTASVKSFKVSGALKLEIVKLLLPLLGLWKMLFRELGAFIKSETSKCFSPDPFKLNSSRMPFYFGNHEMFALCVSNHSKLW